MDTDEVFVEELDSNDVPEAELSQFREVEVIVQVHEDVAAAAAERKEKEQQAKAGALIQRFVRDGERQLPDFCTKLGSDDELDEGEEEEEEEKIEEAIQADDKELNRAGKRDVLDATINIKKEIDEIPILASTSKASAASLRSRKLSESLISAKNLEKQHNAFENDDPMKEANAGDDGSRTQRPTPKRRPVLNVALQCMMGEANLSFARGQIAIAEKICLEIIRQNPLAPEPFFTLAEIYEARDPEKYLNFLTIAAHLNPHEREQWVRITDMHIAQNNLQQARVFYTKAIKVFPRDYDLRLRKARLLEQLGNEHAAKYTYLKMLPLVPPKESTLCLSIAQDIARYFHAHNKMGYALNAMQSAYAVCGRFFKLEDLNLYMDLLLLHKAYGRVLLILRNHTHLDMKCSGSIGSGNSDENADNLLTVSHCSVPEDFVPEFRAKLYVSLIHLNTHHLFDYIVQTSHAHIDTTTESQLDLFIDIVEAFMHCKHYTNAYELLRPITQAAGDGLECPAFVWLRQAECLHQCNRIDEAIDSFARVVELAPLCYKARFTLSALLKQQGRHIEAVRALEQPTDEDGINPRLLYERCVMLNEIGDIDEFHEVGFLLLSRNSLLLRSREELMAVGNGINAYNADSLKFILQMRNITEDTDLAMQEYNKTTNDSADLTVQDEYDLFLRLVRSAHTHRRYSYAQRLCFAMITTKRFIGYSSELERIIILACYFNDDCQLAFSYLRELTTKQLDNIALWNLLSLLVQKSQELRYHRYARRLFKRQECSRELRLFVAHYHLHCCSYKYALNAYAPLYREQQHPIAAFCMAVIFNQLSLQKRVLRKTAAISHAITFAHKYAEWRSGLDGKVAQTMNYKCAAQQEIFYNIGRIYHQSGMLHLALTYYERGLAVQDPLLEENEEYLSLKQEIAYNMHLIYLNSGNRQKARQLIHQYCVV